jgi:GAF domain-containing protein/HAMP domain-containing protein
MTRQANFEQPNSLSNQLSRRGRFLSFIAVLALIALSVVGLGASLQSTERQLNEASASAVLTFNVFINNIEGDLKATADVLPSAISPKELLARALNRQPAIFELVFVDPQGKVLAQRRRTSSTGESIIEQQPWLKTVQAGNIYLGPMYYEQFSGEPFIDIAIPVTDTGSNFIGSLVSRTDLTALWQPITGLRIGEQGYVYITDQTGQLLAFRDVKVVKQGVNIQTITGRLPQAIVNSGIHLYKGIAGQNVIASGKPLGVASWYVIVEQPANEALLFFMVLLVILLIMLIAVGFLANSVINFIQTRIVVPLHLMQAGAAELHQGQFKTRIDIQSKDELGELADTFNLMTAQIEASFNTLEQRVVERTAELDSANKKNTERALRLRTIAEIGNTITSLENLDELLPRIAQRVSEALGVYHAGIFLLDSNGEYAVLRATNSEGGRRMLARGHRLRVGQTGIVGFVTASGTPRIALDVGEDAEFFDNPDLPETHSELALPLRMGRRTIGALDVQSKEIAAFDDEDAELLSIVANQVVIAIQNARQFEDAQERLKEAQQLYHQFLRQEWKSVAEEKENIGYRYSNKNTLPLKERVVSPEIIKAAKDGEISIHQSDCENKLAIPIKLRGEVIGVLNVQIKEDRQWDQDEIDIAQAVAERVALGIENARLLESSQNQASKERVIGEISTKISAATNVDNILKTAVGELGNIIPDTDIFIQFITEDALE